MDEDEVLSKITRLLERGCTMLATHHDCGAPLFRCQGKIVCPVCSVPEEMAKADLSIAGDERSASSESVEEMGKERETAMEPGKDAFSEGSEGQGPSVVDGELVEAKARLRASLIARLDDMSRMIRSEQDLGQLKRLLDCAEALLRVLRSI